MKLLNEELWDGPLMEARGWIRGQLDDRVYWQVVQQVEMQVRQRGELK